MATKTQTKLFGQRHHARPKICQINCGQLIRLNPLIGFGSKARICVQVQLSLAPGKPATNIISCKAVF